MGADQTACLVASLTCPGPRHQLFAQIKKESQLHEASLAELRVVATKCLVSQEARRGEAGDSLRRVPSSEQKLPDDVQKLAEQRDNARRALISLQRAAKQDHTSRMRDRLAHLRRELERLHAFTHADASKLSAHELHRAWRGTAALDEAAGGAKRALGLPALLPNPSHTPRQDSKPQQGHSEPEPEPELGERLQGLVPSHEPDASTVIRSVKTVLDVHSEWLRTTSPEHVERSTDSALAGFGDRFRAGLTCLDLSCFLGLQNTKRGASKMSPQTNFCTPFWALLLLLSGPANTPGPQQT